MTAPQASAHPKKKMVRTRGSPHADGRKQEPLGQLLSSGQEALSPFRSSPAGPCSLLNLHLEMSSTWPTWVVNLLNAHQQTAPCWRCVPDESREDVFQSPKFIHRNFNKTICPWPGAGIIFIIYGSLRQEESSGFYCVLPDERHSNCLHDVP